MPELKGYQMLSFSYQLRCRRPLHICISIFIYHRIPALGILSRFYVGGAADHAVLPDSQNTDSSALQSIRCFAVFTGQAQRMFCFDFLAPLSVDSLGTTYATFFGYTSSHIAHAAALLLQCRSNCRRGYAAIYVQGRAPLSLQG